MIKKTNICLETNTDSGFSSENLVASDSHLEIGSAGIYFGVCVAQPWLCSIKSIRLIYR